MARVLRMVSSSNTGVHRTRVATRPRPRQHADQGGAASGTLVGQGHAISDGRFVGYATFNEPGLFALRFVRPGRSPSGS